MSLENRIHMSVRHHDGIPILKDLENYLSVLFFLLRELSLCLYYGGPSLPPTGVVGYLCWPGVGCSQIWAQPQARP